MSTQITRVTVHYSPSSLPNMETFEAQSFEIVGEFVQIRTNTKFFLIPRNGNIRKIEFDR